MSCIGLFIYGEVIHMEYANLMRDEKRYIILIIYDISDNKRRLKMVECLEKYGLRVQKSAFEAYITKKQYERLERQAKALIDIEEDSLRIYFLADHTAVRSWGVGDCHVEEIIVL